MVRGGSRVVKGNRL